jgi:imidazolonepropionase-like amidohydrolase
MTTLLPPRVARAGARFLALGAFVMSLPAPSLRAQPTLPVRAFTGATLIDGTTRAPIANATIVVRSGRVVAAGPSNAVRVPAGAERIALDGKTVIPGLINAHGHASSVANLATYAAYGVTTVYSLGDETPEVFASRDAQRSAPPAHARVYLAGPVLTPTTPEEARAQVEAVVARNVDIVKIRVDDNLGTAKKMPPEVYRAVIREAHARGKRVAVHIYYLDDARALLDAGADYIAHSVRDVAVDAPFVQALKQSGVCYSPTLMREVSTFVYDTIPAFFRDSQFLAHANRQWMTAVSEPARMAATRTSTSAQRYKAQLPVAMRNLATLDKAGVPIAMGTDTGPLGRFQGFFELMEMEMMVDAGLSPRTVLASATLGAARCLRLDRELGSLEPGKWADFVVLDASPLTDMRNIRKQHSVWIGGRQVNTRGR